MSQRVLVASNRGPVTFREVDGDLVPRRGSGGLVTALAPAVQDTGGLWVAAAMSDGDRERASESPDGKVEVVTGDAKYRIRLLSFDPEVYDQAYNTVSNRLLWFLHHYLWDLPRAPDLGLDTQAAWESYQQVNQAFAQALAEEAGKDPASVLIQDYHLSLVPARLRDIAPTARSVHFHHVPFAGADYLRLLPRAIREELLGGLLGADVVGFQTERWAENFLGACRLLEGADVFWRRRAIRWQGRLVRVGVYPISIDAALIRSLAGAPGVRDKRRELEAWRGDRRLLLRVDRAELSKNILRGFLAFEDFLRRYPEWKGKVVFLALLNPSRWGIEDYREYLDASLREAERVNKEYGGDEWTPIEVRVGDNYEEVLAAYGMYDALMVNPVFDGMNLVAKEGPLLNRRQGALILSRTAGAYAELGKAALGVDPVDIAGTADAIAAAMTMPAEQRGQRAGVLRRTAAARSPAQWAKRQLRDLERAAG
ncbi:MAG TPA: trehalose-6-phosphate synthase [Actinomycetota bacterium]|nr:trehalose-6-phosphate synthase [Actinomycetota bacterium]